MATGAGPMSKAERVQAALAGGEVDRTPISFWHHFPARDQTVEGLVEATLEFQQRFDLDLVKLMPTGMYSVVDYGATVVLRDDAIGTTQLATTPIQSAADWGRLPPAPPDRGLLADQVEVVGRVRAGLGPSVPIIQTIFSPLTMAQKLAGGAFLDHLGRAEGEVEGALRQFAEDVVTFGRACLEAGADGFFFATQQANQDAQLPDGTFERLGAAYDLRVLEALAGDERSWCMLLHLHGSGPRFELADRYPVQAVNWHDRETAPSIRQALGQTRRALVAGIDRRAAPTAGPEALAAEVRDAIEQVGGRRLIVGPGCVIPTTTPEQTLTAMRRAAG